jgi:hypothetical protein
MEKSKCPICNREDCKRWKSGRGGVQLFPAASLEDNDCFFHRIDWRARALTLEVICAKLLEQIRRVEK